MRLGGVAILFFSRGVQSERRHRFYGLKDTDRHALTSHMIRTSKDAIIQSGLPYYHIDQKQQNGGDFYSRLSNAFDQVFELGYEAVIAVGCDTPSIGDLQWKAIAQKLLNGEVVLGGTRLGGAYLIGLPKAYNKAQWTKLPWRTDRLFSALEALLHEQETSFTKLDLRTEVHTKAQFITAIAETSALVSKSITRILFGESEINQSSSIWQNQPRFWLLTALRGPPLNSARL